MGSRAESAAATRCALLAAVAELLSAGGPEVVTLREVGARAGVSRGAPYRHFTDKESLLTAIGVESWERVADRLGAIRTRLREDAPAQLRAALLMLVEICRSDLHLYLLMFSAPAGDPGSAVRAARRAQDEFLTIVASVAGEADARRYCALLLTSAHGVAGLESSGHLSEEKWHTTAEELVEMTVMLVAAEPGDRDTVRTWHT